MPQGMLSEPYSSRKTPVPSGEPVCEIGPEGAVAKRLRDPYRPGSAARWLDQGEEQGDSALRGGTCRRQPPHRTGEKLLAR